MVDLGDEVGSQVALVRQRVGDSGLLVEDDPWNARLDEGADGIAHLVVTADSGLGGAAAAERVEGVLLDLSAGGAVAGEAVFEDRQL